MSGTNLNTGSLDALVRRAIGLEYFTVAWTAMEAFVALIAGALASSIALVGFGLDSIIEVVSGLTLLWRFKRRQLEDRTAESRAVKVVGLTFFALSAYVGYQAVRTLWVHRPPQFSLPGMILAAVAFVVMLVLGFAKRELARLLNSRALAADAIETLMCACLSATLLVGLSLNGWLAWWWADPVAALAMSGFMVREGVEAFGG